jgi:hypothetical protein
MKGHHIYVSALLGMLAAVMAFHIILLHTGLRECDAYEAVLIERLKVVKVGTPEALALRKELQEYLTGKTTECAQAEEVFADASDKYTAIILSLLTGAGTAAGVNRGVEIMTRKPDQD